MHQDSLYLPKVTIVVPTYQRAQLLKKTIESVLNQTYTNFTLCICDNYSQDETEQVVHEFKAKDSRIQYHRHAQNLGLIKNYQFGFAQIATPYFSFLSDDDTLAPCFLEIALNDFAKYPNAGFVACGVKAIDMKGNPVYCAFSEWKQEGYFQSPMGLYEMIDPVAKYPIPTGVLFNKELIHDVEPCWEDKLQLLWDPEYLIQIAARYPIVVNNTTCGFFLAHEGAFSTGFYHSVQTNPKLIKVVVEASLLLVQRLQNNSKIAPETREKASKHLRKTFHATGRHFIQTYISKRQSLNALYCAWMHYSNFGFDWEIPRFILRKLKNLSKRK